MTLTGIDPNAQQRWDWKTGEPLERELVRVPDSFARSFESAMLALVIGTAALGQKLQGLAAAFYWTRWDEIEWDWPEPVPFADHERILTVAGGKLFRVTRCATSSRRS